MPLLLQNCKIQPKYSLQWFFKIINCNKITEFKNSDIFPRNAPFSHSERNVPKLVSWRLSQKSFLTNSYLEYTQTLSLYQQNLYSSFSTKLKGPQRSQSDAHSFISP